jgi:hypothetical protein
MPDRRGIKIPIQRRWVSGFLSFLFAHVVRFYLKTFFFIFFSNPIEASRRLEQTNKIKAIAWFFLHFPLLFLVKFSTIRWQNHVRRFGSQSSLDLLAFPFSLSVLFVSFLKYCLTECSSLGLVPQVPPPPRHFVVVFLSTSNLLYLSDCGSHRQGESALFGASLRDCHRSRNFSRTLTPGPS